VSENGREVCDEVYAPEVFELEAGLGVVWWQLVDNWAS
jgi:hypothetical protein